MIRDISQWPQVALRPVVGIGLVYHAGPALLTPPGYGNFAHMLGEVGLPWPELTAGLVAGLELVGGLAILAGALTIVFSLLLVVELSTRVGIIFLIGRGFPQPLPGQPSLPGYETNLLYVALLLALAVAGGGLFSVDRWRALPAPRPELRYGQRPGSARRRVTWS